MNARALPQKPTNAARSIDPGSPAREAEADRVADRIVRGNGDRFEPSIAPATSSMQAQVPQSVPAVARSVLASSGQPLLAGTRERLESRFGSDFSHVRIHADAHAAASAHALKAQAYTVGNHIVFGAGRYIPAFDAGHHLLAHELTHVLQQGAAPPHNRGRLGINQASVGLYRKELPEADAEEKKQEGADDPAKDKTVAKPSFTDGLDYDAIAKELHDAMAGLGTDEEAVYYALNRLHRDPKAIETLASRYKSTYKADLIDDIRDEFSGSELEYALQLLNAGNSGSEQAITGLPSSDKEWIAAVQRLNAAFEGIGTDEEAVFAVLTPFGRMLEKITVLKVIYKQVVHRELRDDIVDEMSGSERDYALWLTGEQPIHREESKATAAAQSILAYIKSEAAKRSKTPPSIDPNSDFVKVLKSRYLADYFKDPSAKSGQQVVDQGIGRQMEGQEDGLGGAKVRAPGGKWRQVRNQWELMAITWLNQQKLPAQLKQMKGMPLLKNLQGLPDELGAATDILRDENTAKLPYIDIPALIGKVNPDITDINADVRGGGKNISQLMHWATGVKYAAQKPEALRELFLAYETWHLEGWDVFGQDSLNDLIAENQGRMLGSELLKGKAGQLRGESDLMPFLDRTFAESRAWVGTLLRMRKEALDAWILDKQQKPASMHWMEKEQIWPSLTVYQMLADGTAQDEVKKSFIVDAAIEIYTLVFEADEWEKAHGEIELTALEKALVRGDLDKVLAVMAKAEVGKASIGDLIEAKSAIDGLKGVK